MALVSIIMPTYNCAEFIAESVESVLDQSMADWELEIVDDGSTDDTLDVLRPYLAAHSNIHYTRFDENRGPAVARTEAIRRASGKYIAFLDSDDLWHPQKLEKQIRFMEEKGCPFSCTAYRCIDEMTGKNKRDVYPPDRTNYKQMLRLSNPIGNMTVMYDQTKLGKYEVPHMRKRNDFALWLKILKDTPECMGLQEVLATYRMRSNSVSRRKLTLVKYHWKLYFEIEGLGFLLSFWYTLCWAFVKGTGIGLRRNRLSPREGCVFAKCDKNTTGGGKIYLPRPKSMPGISFALRLKNAMVGCLIALRVYSETALLNGLTLRSDSGVVST